MFSLKKNSRFARLGEQPLHQKYKNEGGECFCIQKLLPPSFNVYQERNIRDKHMTLFYKI